MRVAAAVTTGQSPRDDILGEMRALTPGVEWIERGALDNLADGVLEGLAPRPGEFPIVTHLRSGRTVMVGDRSITPLLQQAADAVSPNASILVVPCSGPLTIESSIPLLLPDRLLMASVRAIQQAAPVAVVTPSKDQIVPQQQRWNKLGVPAFVLAASPYTPTDFSQVGKKARECGAGLVVLDCLAYSRSMKNAAAQAAGLPVLLVRSLMARLTTELIGDDLGDSAGLVDGSPG